MHRSIPYAQRMTPFLLRQAFTRRGISRHPALIDADHIEGLLGVRQATPLRKIYRYQPRWGRIGDELGEEITRIMRPVAPQGGSAPESATSQD